MKKWIKAVILLLAGCMLLLHCGNDGFEGVSSDVANQFSQMPESVSGLAYVNMDQVRKSLFYEMITDSMEMHINEDEEFRDLVDATGFDFRRDIDEVYIGFNPASSGKK